MNLSRHLQAKVPIINLQTLYLTGNRVTELLESMALLKKLRRLDLGVSSLTQKSPRHIKKVSALSKPTCTPAFACM
jgi:Leucine-rich repeat (LRR) protein